MARLLGIAFEEGTPCLISPWYNNGNVRDYLRITSNSNRPRLVSDVANGLLYLHSSNVVHGDLKGDNVLVDENGAARLIDFGMSKLIEEAASGYTTSSLNLGTARWMSPELLHSQSKDCHRTRSSDVYAFACTALEILSSKQPFEHIIQDIRVTVAILKGEKPSRNDYPNVILPEITWTLFERCWERDPAARPEMQEVQATLN